MRNNIVDICQAVVLVAAIAAVVTIFYFIQDAYNERMIMAFERGYEETMAPGHSTPVWQKVKP